MGAKSRSIKILSIWGREGVIVENIFLEELDMQIRMVNDFGPYMDRLGFWNRIITR